MGFLKLYYNIANNKQKLKYNVLNKLKQVETFKLVKSNKKYKNTHRNDRCFILGNGPSLNLEDLSLLGDEIVFTVNQIARHKDFDKIKPNYHFWADPIFFELSKNRPEDMELLQSFKRIKTYNNSPECFFPVEAKGFIEEFELNKTLNINYFNSKLTLHDFFDEAIEFDKIIPGFYTVVQWAISMAIYMGFKEIYLLGCDTTTILTKINLVLNSGESQYAYEITKNEKARMEKTINKHSMEVQMRVEAEVLKGYRILNTIALKQNVQLYNCSQTTIIDSVRRSKYKDVLGKNDHND